MVPGDLLSAFPHRQFHTLPGLLDSWAALPNSNPNACVPMQGGSLYHFYNGLWYDPAERRTHDLPCERRTRYRLSQPDTVTSLWMLSNKCESKQIDSAKLLRCGNHTLIASHCEAFRHQGRYRQICRRLTEHPSPRCCDWNVCVSLLHWQNQSASERVLYCINTGLA